MVKRGHGGPGAHLTTAAFRATISTMNDKQDKKPRRGSFMPRLLSILRTVGLVLVFLLGLGTGTMAFYSRGLPSTKTLEDIKPKQGTKVFDRDSVLVYE